MKHLIAIIILLGLSHLQTLAQSPLKIGEKVPDYTLTKLINYPSSTAKISDFKGKLLILDFWSTGCSSCMLSFSKLLVLQQKFKDRIAIIMVNSFQDESTVRKVYERQKKLKSINMTLPTVCGDSLPKKFFPHIGVPHIVWIDEQGILQYITYGESLIEKNIQAVLDKKRVYMKTKTESDHFDIVKQLFTVSNGGVPNDTLWQSSLFKGPANAYPTYGIHVVPGMNIYRVLAANQCIRDLYRLAYSRDSLEWNITELTVLNKVEMQVKDSSALIASFYDVNDETAFQRLYTYDLIGPKQSRRSLQRYMQEDLNRYFGLQAQWEQKEKMCLVLTASDTAKISYHNGPPKKYLDSFKLDLNDVPVSYFFDHLIHGTDFLFLPYPLLDETGLKGNLGHIAFEGDMNSVEVVNKNLSKYGMKFSLARRKVDVLVIRDKEQ